METKFVIGIKKWSTMDIHASRGTKVRVHMEEGKVCNGHDSDKEDILEHLDPQKEYTVEDIEVHSFSSVVYLKEDPKEIGFNTVCFLQEQTEDQKVNLKKFLLKAAKWEELLTEEESTTITFAEARERVIDRILQEMTKDNNPPKQNYVGC